MTEQFESFYVIWSNEHRAWWKPGRAGYTSDLAAAGRYAFRTAAEICYEAGPSSLHIPGSSDGGVVPAEIMMPLACATVSMIWHRQNAALIAGRRR